MGWFSSKKADSLSGVPTLQQVSPMKIESSPEFIPSIDNTNTLVNNPSNVSSVSREIGSSYQMNRNDPFFVRIDKFNEAKKNLGEIERKMRDMENILVRLGETKQKEDREIDSWKRDMKEIRSYLEEINGSVFNRL